MARARLELLSELLTEAYERSEHALLRNLEAVSDSQWSSPVHPGGRSIAAIVAHAGACKWVYENNAFGDGALGWDGVMALAPTTRAALLEWLGEGHTRLVTSVQGLDDDIALEEPRMTHWGTPVPALRIIRTTIEHDLYHAGEINHLRALLDGSDGWP